MRGGAGSERAGGWCSRQQTDTTGFTGCSAAPRCGSSSSNTAIATRLKQQACV